MLARLKLAGLQLVDAEGGKAIVAGPGLLLRRACRWRGGVRFGRWFDNGLFRGFANEGR